MILYERLYGLSRVILTYKTFNHLTLESNHLVRSVFSEVVSYPDFSLWLPKIARRFSIYFSMDMMSLNKLQEVVKDREAWCVAVHGFTKSRT